MGKEGGEGGSFCEGDFLNHRIEAMMQMRKVGRNSTNETGGLLLRDAGSS